MKNTKVKPKRSISYEEQKRCFSLEEWMIPESKEKKIVNEFEELGDYDLEKYLEED